MPTPRYVKAKPKSEAARASARRTRNAPDDRVVTIRVAEGAATPEASFLVRAGREVKSWAFALIAAGSLLTIGAPYVLPPPHISVESQCGLAKDIHNDYLAHAPATAKDRALSDAADRDLKRCLND